MIEALIEGLESLAFLTVVFGAVWACDRLINLIHNRFNEYRAFERYVMRRNVTNERRLRELSQRR